jgi:uncharacterized protein
MDRTDMKALEPSHTIKDIKDLEELYGAPSPPSIAKEVDYIHPIYRQFIELAPFAVLATGTEHGLDASPRGDPSGLVIVEDEKTLLIPDRPGNNRIDSLRNIVVNPNVALFFLVPGVGETMRVNGTATISVDPDLLDKFVINGRPPRAVIVVHVETAFFQCSKAVIRADLWNPEKQVDRSALPSTGAILAEVSKGRIDAGEYDREAPARIKAMLY